MIQVTQISHFDYVKDEDLDKIGMGKPAQRRLWEAVKKAKHASQKKQSSSSSWFRKVPLLIIYVDTILTSVFPPKSFPKLCACARVVGIHNKEESDEAAQFAYA